MDPLGLAMENFNTIGQWKELPKRLTRELAGKMPNGDEFKDFAGLKSQLMKHKDAMVESMIEALIKYGLGREQEFSDQDFVEELLKVTKENGYRFKPLMIAFLSSKQFTQK